MFIAIRERMEEREEGFTLIELLVVVIIIGILAAIAIPVFLRQRERGWAAASQSDARNAAISMEAYFTQNGQYADASGTRPLVGAPSWTGVWTDEQDFKPSAGVTTTVTSLPNAGGVADQAYCITAVHVNSTAATDTYYLGSGGTLNNVAC